ncbi:diadenylate cyclase CdaM [Mycoplasma suis]|uniref:DisA protein domain n=2 Tax=Mycoplasma suis TaxID=57372 RepID=F0QR81_MYCSL|nr:diadenylate cyclase CdaM [Mycoplasma suis]ADX98001.1 DisA protein domain [Mycoplasma suis str. Illinois]CBZ40497.1 conserved hypothetical protein, DisA-domain [Mycoplasma suis KI3806]
MKILLAFNSTTEYVNYAILACVVLILFLVFWYVSNEKVWFSKYTWKIFRRKNISQTEFDNFIGKFGDVLIKFSRKKIGALIVIEKYQNLQKYINLGYAIHSRFFPDFLYNVFLNKESSMHDGGVIMRGIDIKSVSSYFPITSAKNTPNEYGSRHRAAMGITGRTDAIVFLVSESSGKIMFSQGGEIHSLNRNNKQLLVKKIEELLSFYIK